MSERINRGPAVILGILLILLGIAAIGSPLQAGIAVLILVGSFLIASGVLEIVYAFRVRRWVLLLSGLLAIVCGGLLLGHQLAGLTFLTLLLIVYFFVDGITRMAAAFELRPAPGWGWLLFGGLVSVALGVLIWRQWPLSGMWAVGTLAGVHILIAGWALVALGVAKRAPAVREGTRTAG
jgi:uncharacterized membrane protein HdeD (DUF308 family)